MGRPGFSFVLTGRFLPLFVTQFLGALNDNLFRQALIMLITYKAVDMMAVQPAVLNNIAIGLFILPFFLFSALAGQLADKYEKSGQIFWIKLWELGLTLLGAIGFYLASLPILILVLAGLGLQSTFFGPIKYAILPDLIHKDELLSANALVEAGTFIAILLGMIISGLVVLKSGGMAVISGLTVAVALMGVLAGRRVPKTGRAAPDLELKFNIFAETGRQLKSAWASDVSRPAINGISWIWLYGSVYLTQIPVLTRDYLHGDEAVATLILAFFSIGVGAGSILCSRILKGRISASLAAPGLVALAVFGLTLHFLVPSAADPGGLSGVGPFLANGRHWLVLGNMALLAMSAGVVIVPLYAILQDRTDRASRSRIIATTNIVNSGYMAAGSLMAAGLIQLGLSPRDILLLTGLGGLLFIRTLNRLQDRL